MQAPSYSHAGTAKDLHLIQGVFLDLAIKLNLRLRNK